MTVYLLCGVVVLQAVMHYLERKDLYNRLMSKDLSEYKHFSGGYEEKPRETAHEKAIKAWRNGKS